MLKKDSYLLLLLFLPIVYIFYYLVTWVMCTPIENMGSNVKLFLERSDIPAGSTCYLDNHMTTISFFSFPPIEENMVTFSALIVLLAVLLFLVYKPTLKLLSAESIKSLFHH